MTTPALYRLFRQHPKVSTDTRKIVPNSIFFALKGANFNGNAFAQQALEAGCAYAVIDEVEYQQNDRCILVDDVLTSLQQLATYHRQQFKIPFIGITGSNGKTTTKELILSVLQTQYRTVATVGNFNNHIGVPLTLLSIPDDCELAIIEMGANHREDIAELSEIALPDYGIITNIGKAHLEGFGGLEGVEYAKSRLYEFIRKTNGKLFVNGDNAQLMRLSEGIDRILYGSREDHFVRASLTSTFPFLHLSWAHETATTDPIETQIIGSYNFENILVALCVGRYFGVSRENVIRGISNYRSDNNRSQLIKQGSNTILLDAYNANPTSMSGALRNFKAWDTGQPKLAVLGDMFELGEYAEVEHQSIIDLASELGLEQVVLVGQHFGGSALPAHFQHCSTTEEAMTYLKDKKISGHALLIKGSRGVRLERLLEVLPS
ncbi:MAG: UDP-N-acetylmuramoyl-tripeptide--D-alanyl-D-alanine ligase [Salibacteraceae bacterium]